MSYVVTETDTHQDRETILDLWTRNLPATSENRYSWLYERGPAVSWLLRSGSGQAIGATGLMRRTFRSPAGNLRAGQAIDLCVDRSHRAAGPALGLQRAVTATVENGELDLIYGFPNEKSEAVLRRVGYNTIGNLTRWVKLLSSEKVIEPWLPRRLPRKATSLAVDCLLKLTSPEWRYRLPDNLHLEVTDRFDQRFDALWQTAAPRFHFVGERTSDYLNWRFGQCPNVVHRAFCLSEKDARLVAYLVYSLRGSEAYVSDLFFTNVSNLKLLLARFLRQMRWEKVGLVGTDYTGSSLVTRTLRSFGFWQRPSQWKAMLFFDPQRFQGSGERLLDNESWFLTRADVDSDH